LASSHVVMLSQPLVGFEELAIPLPPAHSPALRDPLAILVAASTPRPDSGARPVNSNRISAKSVMRSASAQTLRSRQAF
jgi:hypothetical protein